MTYLQTAKSLIGSLFSSPTIDTLEGKVENRYQTLVAEIHMLAQQLAPLTTDNTRYVIEQESGSIGPRRSGAHFVSTDVEKYFRKMGMLVRDLGGYPRGGEPDNVARAIWRGERDMLGIYFEPRLHLQASATVRLGDTYPITLTTNSYWTHKQQVRVDEQGGRWSPFYVEKGGKIANVVETGHGLKIPQHARKDEESSRWILGAENLFAPHELRTRLLFDVNEGSILPLIKSGRMALQGLRDKLQEELNPTARRISRYAKRF